MSCRDKTHTPNHISEAHGGSAVNQPNQAMITYKYLELTRDRRFQSPIADVEWDKGLMEGRANNEENVPDWVWSCTTKDNPELLLYKGPDRVLVTLQVWGKVLVGDNGVVRSQFARIIDYDIDDYYLASYFLDLISFEEAEQLMGKDNPRYQELRSLAVIKSPDGELEGRRLLACYSAGNAYYFAKNTDRSSHPETRKAACQHPFFAYQYALYIDRCARDDTRSAACRDPFMAYLYAVNIDRCPRDDTRSAACRDPYVAVLYAANVDRQAREDTRLAACRSPQQARHYAAEVDGGPHDDTRRAACQNPEDAYLYATQIDQCFHPETYLAVIRDAEWSKKYNRWFRTDIEKYLKSQKKPKFGLFAQ